MIILLRPRLIYVRLMALYKMAGKIFKMSTNVAKKTAAQKAAKPRKSTSQQRGASPSQLIDARIEDLDDWRGATLSRLRGLIKEADPGVVEEWKWRGFRFGHTTD
jgi:hypothetical protein